MRKHFHLLVFALSLFVLFNSCNQNKNSKAKVALGMVIEDRSQLRNIPFADVPFGGTELPKLIDMSDKMPDPGNQGEQQSCVAWAIAYALKSYQENVQLGTKLLFSPSYIYNQINNGQNVPTVVQDALNILSQQGVCLYDEMPYNQGDWKSQPTAEMKASAKRFKIANWRQINTVDIKEVKTFLAGGLPVVIGANVSGDFIQDGFRKGKNFIWSDKGTPEGGHAMLIVGYDDDKSAFKIINSWGNNWGDNGYGWISYDLFKQPDVIMYGFVTKDDYTDPAIVQNIKTKKQQTKEQTNQQPEETTKTQDKTKNNNPLEYDNIDFHQNNVVYNVVNPDPNHKDQSMKIEGTIDIPAKYGKNFYIIVHVFDKETNQQVKSLIYPDYSDLNHGVAGYTNNIPLDDERWHGKWWVHIPYTSMDLPKEKKNLYAVPTLFVDNYAVAKGERFDFWVDKSALGENTTDNTNTKETTNTRSTRRSTDDGGAH